MAMIVNSNLRRVAAAASAALLMAALAVPVGAVDAPPSPVLVGDARNGATIDNLRLNGDATTVVTVQPGASVEVKTATTVTSLDCPTCVTHVPAGFEGGPFGACLWAGLGGYGPNPQSSTFTLVAPTDFGVYDVVAAYHWNYGCADWWNGTGTTFAKVVVASPPEEKADCKKGGWHDLSTLEGRPFRNQGLCVAYYNHAIRAR